jgi:hypothetical protein
VQFIPSIIKASLDLVKSIWGFFSSFGDRTIDYAFFWFVKIPLAFIFLSYIISGIVWMYTWGNAIYVLVSSWYKFWSFGSFADVGVGLFSGFSGGLGILRAGMYKASSNIVGIPYDMAPRNESMLCYLDDSINMLGDLLSARPWKKSTCTYLASVGCTLNKGKCTPQASCLLFNGACYKKSCVGYTIENCPRWCPWDHSKQ